MDYREKTTRLALARRIAREAMVLLRNDGLLPLERGSKVALVGRTQLSTIIGGSGSGASRGGEPLQLPNELEKAGIVPEEHLIRFYAEYAKRQAEKADGEKIDFDPEKLAGLVASGLIYELFGKYTPAAEEPLPPAELWEAAAEETDTALLIIGRQTGGEECDRHVEDDYELTASERELVRLTCAHFPKVIVLLNVNGLVDLSWMNDYPEIGAALLLGTGGEQAAGAAADLLSGVCSPSGKLAQTAALRYEDYPTAEHFTSLKDDPARVKTYASYGLSAEDNGSTGFALSPVTVYAEDIYVGYRYFDSFERDVLYPFGYGLSYATFELAPGSMSVEYGAFAACVRVTNTSGKHAGKEVVQLYVHAPFGQGPRGLKKPRQELRAIAKTPELAPGESCEVTLRFPLRELASFDEQRKRWVIDPGKYTVLIGNSSRHTKPAAELFFPVEIVTRTVTADIGIAEANLGKVAFTEPDHELPVPAAEGLPRFTVDAVEADWPSYRGYDFSVAPVPSTLADVAAGKVTMEQFVSQMSVEELAVLCNGYGSGLPFMGMGRKAPFTIRYPDGSDIGSGDNPNAKPGYCNPALAKYGIPTTVYQDGPAGVGGVAWPTGMMLACTFDPALAYEFGAACGKEAEERGIDSWLAPGMNLIRNPIEGRAFEYFSEDPLITGLMAAAIIRGAEENNRVTACPKHFALNEQETFRRGKKAKNIDAVDSIVSGRAARELYLRPFERAITEGKPRMVMSSFNKINGIFAAGNRVLCTGILRDEWGFDGVVVTDWGDLDYVADGADAVQAGNDVIMPGGPPVIEQVLKGYEEGRVSLDALREAAAHLMNYLLETRPFLEKQE